MVKFNSNIIFIFIIPIVFWSIIILVFNNFGLEMTVKTAVNFLFGIVYGYISILCWCYYDKSRKYEIFKKMYEKDFVSTNDEQKLLEEKKRKKNLSEYSEYHDKFNKLNKDLYLIQGFIAIAVCVEFLLGW